MQITTFPTPRRARIRNDKFAVFGPTLTQMGLRAQAFRAIGLSDKRQVIVHPDDVTGPEKNPFPITVDVVEFVET